MASIKSVRKSCEPCANTGILHASLVREVDARRIAVVVCADHFTAEDSAVNELAQKTCEAMHCASGLQIDIVRVEKPIAIQT